MVADLIRYSLRLDDEWWIYKLAFDEQNQSVDVYVSHSGDTLVCPETGKHGTMYNHHRARSWRHLDWLHFKCFVR